MRDRLTQELLQTFKWDILGHPSHSPDLAPSDYHVFGKLKEYMGGGEMFDDDDETKDEVLKWLNQQAAEFYTQASRSSSPDPRNALRNVATKWKNK
jgi:hypothetical protein